jgi:hypothetical protein
MSNCQNRAAPSPCKPAHGLSAKWGRGKIQPVLDHVDDAADHAPVVNAAHAVRERKEWQYPRRPALAQ